MRLTILQFLHMVLTDARTFIILAQSSYYSSPGQVVRSYLHNYFVARQNSYFIDPQFSGDMGQYYLPGLDLHTKNSVRQGFYDLTLQIDCILLWYRLP